ILRPLAQFLEKRRRRGALAEGEIGEQTVPSAFAAKTAFFVATERAGGIKFVVGVRPNHARAQLVYDLENFAPLVRPDAGAQSVRRVVGTRDCFLRRAESHHTQDRPENFFLCNPMRSGYSGEETWWIPV